MKRLFLLIISIGIILSFNNLRAEDNLQELLSKPQPNFYDIQKVRLNQFKMQSQAERRGWKQFKRWEYFWESRTFPTGEFPNGYKIYSDYTRFYKNTNRNKLQGVQWKLLGPINTPTSTDVREQGLGRINVVRINPNNENELWIGAASGGVWRTTNNGSSWQSFPFTNFLSLGVSDIAIAKTNPNIVYVATGDADGTIGTGGKDFYTIGLIKTTDAGTTWTVTGFSKELYESKLITRILLNPDNENIILAATNVGIYKSIDGGDTWTLKTTEGSYIDMEFKPGDYHTIYASTYNYSGSCFVSVSTDNGETWKKVYSVPYANRLAIATTPANPDYVYCLASNVSSYGFEGFYLSTDAGNTWMQRASTGTVPNILGWYDGLDSDIRGQGTYDLSLCVSPKNSTLIYTGGVNIWKSSDLAITFDAVSSWTYYNNLPFVHADIHNFEFSPSGSRLYVTSDGGISVSTDNGTTWRDISNGLSITQFYKMGTSDNDLTAVIGGCQDNGTSMRVSEGNWKHISSADGMDCIIDPTNSNRIYYSIYYGTFYRSDDKGNSSARIGSSITEEGGWVTPLILNPQNPKVLFAGYYNVWKNSNYGSGKWTKLSSFSSSQSLVALAIAPSDTNVIYSANYSNVYASYNGGTSWSVLYTTSSAAITSIAVDPNNARRLWISKSGFSPNDKVYEINNGDVINLSGNLPNVPVNTIVYQKNSPDRLYIGTDIGVFYSDYGSAYWERFGDDLPNVVVNELEISYGPNSQTKLRAGTYGRGIWETDVINCNYTSPTISYTGSTNFCEGDSLILSIDLSGVNYRWSTGETSPSIVVKESGSYSVIVTYPDGCTAKSKAVMVNIEPRKEITITSETGYFGLCGDNDTLEIRANLGFSSYKWSNGLTERKIKVTEPGDYYVTGTSSNGCESRSLTCTIERYNIPDKPTILRNGNTLVATDGYSHQWYQNGTIIIGATEKEYLILPFDTNSYFQVEVINEGGCKAKSDSFFVDKYSDVRKSDIYNINTIEILPNPTSSTSLLRGKNFDKGKIIIEVRDLLGKPLINQDIYSDGEFEVKLDLTQYSSGEYFIVIKTSNETITKKIIKR